MCRIEWKVLSVVEKDSNNPECYKDVYIKVETDESAFDSFLVAKWTYKHSDSNNCAFKATFSNENELPKIWDFVSYYSNFFGYEILWYKSSEDYTYICPKSPYFNYYEFYDKCNLEWKIKEIHREYTGTSLDTSLKIDVWYWDYVVNTLEWFYYGEHWYWFFVLWATDYKFPKILEWWWVRFFKRNDQVKFVVNSDTWEILKEWNDENLESCNVSNQKLWDFKFEWWLKPMEVVDLNMKLRRKNVLWIEESISQETTQENNEFIIWYKNITNIWWWLIISLFILLLFFIAVLKNSIKRFRLI